MAGISAAELAKINSFPKLVDLLRNHLEWPIEEDYGFEDVVYEYEASELGLKPNEIAKIREIHQLRPLATSQPWGIFFISFEDKALSVTVLRRILKNLILKKRAGAQASDRQAWEKNDLIFAANFGNSGSRELAFVHFSDGAQSRDLPVMKVLGWNARDTQLHNDYVGRTLAEKLRWPDDPKDISKWREEWSSAFELRLNEAIRTSRDLALRLAGLATEIRARANELLGAETDRGPMRTMLVAFRKNLIHDLDEDGFADMFAQTIAYGMLAARISRPAGIVADNLADMVPKTNPFLKELFANFLAIGGHDKRQSLDFDELGVRDVVDMLNAANMEAVLRDFGDRNPKEDPVIHFYELFLKEYDPQKRMQRGVFYTPRPVVNFIVRGVDEILRTEFGLPLGLADTSTWAEVAARNDRITIPGHVKPDAPFVQILDPATGTGTFLVEVIDLIYRRMEEHWKEQGKSAAEIKAAWNAYVPAHLLPRLTAFELMMAPYTIAHMKVGLKLSETGYTFRSQERARIFLTNALEPARDLDMEFIFMSEALAHEAQASNNAKTDTSTTVVVGNPPYSVKSFNTGKWITSLCDIYKENVRNEESQIQSLSNDYIKFIRMGHYSIQKSGCGVFGMITGHGYMLGSQPRDMRKSLIDTFEKLIAINLNGSARRDDVAGPDDPVFEIMTGVGIGIFSTISAKGKRSAQYLSKEGSLEQKMQWLLTQGVGSIPAKSITPTPPNYFFWELGELEEEYMSYLDLPSFFGTGNRSSDKEVYWSTGFASQQDDFAIAFGEQELNDRMQQLATSTSRADISSRYKMCSTNQWDYARALRHASGTGWRKQITSVSYRPFDTRITVIDPSVVTILKDTVQRNFDVDNCALLVSRISNDLHFAHAFVSSKRTDKIFLSSKTSTNTYVIPLWLSPNANENFRRPNVARATSEQISKTIDLIYTDGISSTVSQVNYAKSGNGNAEQPKALGASWDGRGDLERTFGPRDLFDYIYAVLHSLGYRSRYTEFLKSDFPRIPIPASRTTFAALAALGRQLVSFHLLRQEDVSVLKSPEIELRGTGEALVAKGYPEYKNGKVMINASRWFEDVPKATWEFKIGGYQVCEKWLKDRAGKGGKNPSPGRVLTDEDILHYRRIVVALTETRRLMAEIDVEIDKHGGWPDAFVTGAGAN
ncbi:putative helicase [Neorhizobium galegae]|uniref:type ISP restriction/modification enzyme n=1 Tax=Neorhizobium galegae TaxID=399 RepID=UPI001AE927A9|nr:type ISP restriction/modification enzyme [Neorhizobium galegae]MBP2551291.1 putative helicase [Neorhizobium galegae]